METVSDIRHRGIMGRSQRKPGRRGRLLRSARRAIAALHLHPKLARDATPVTNTTHLKLFSVREWSGKAKRMTFNLLGDVQAQTDISRLSAIVTYHE